VLVLLAVAFVLFVGLLVAVDHAVKLAKRLRRRRQASERLAAAAARAEAKAARRRTAEQTSKALTSVIPTIHDVDTRLVE